MFPSINIGPLVFPTAGLIYIVGAWISLSIVERSAKRLNLNPELVYGTAATSLFAGLIGARLAFVAVYWSSFRENLLGIVWPLNSGYNLTGGLIMGVLAGFFYGRIKRLDAGDTLDALAPGLIAGLMFVSLADFLGGPGFGTLTRMPWGITQFSVRRHPVQIYELVAGMLAAFVWLRMWKYRLFAGQLFLLTIAVYSGGRLFVDAYRENAWLSSDGFHLVQIISLIVMVASFYLVGFLSDKATEKAAE